MLTPPDLPVATIVTCLRENYGLRMQQVSFLPIGADINSAVYRVEADDGSPFFLKLRRDDFDEVAVAVPAFLHEQGIRQVMAPLPTASQQLWASGHGFAWILYPYFEGDNGYRAALTDAQWIALGQSMRAVHSAAPPPALNRRVPREKYSPRWRDIVLAFDEQVATRGDAGYDDPIARSFAVFWASKRQEIHLMVERASQLAEALRQRSDAFVLCHADMHPGNVLVGAHDALAIVDWDNPIFAPKERDLMCLGGGFSAAWDDARGEALFYQGYGPTRLDLVALAYYRYERIVADLAAYGAQIFGAQGSVEDREEGLEQVMGQFLPHQVIPIAHKTYEQLP